jgi:hypothetical protein
MTPSEASVRLSSRAYFALSLFSWRVRLGLRVGLFKIAHFSKQRRNGSGAAPCQVRGGLGRFAVNLRGPTVSYGLLSGRAATRIRA